MTIINWNDFLLTSATNGCVNSVREALDNGADVQCKDFEDNTALMLAAKSGHIEIIDVLLEQGASIYSDNIEGKNAVLLAAQAGHSDCLEKIINVLMEGHDIEFEPTHGH